MHIDFRLPIGNEAKANGLTLKSNGKVDRAEGNVPRQGIKDIQDPRVESFIRSQSSEDLGKAWRGRQPDEETGEVVASISGNFAESEPSIASQFLIVDPAAHKVTVQTQDVKGPFFNHWIQASYDPSSGEVNPKTIMEWVSR